VKGKGESLWRSLSVLTGDVICWIDADITNFEPRESASFSISTMRLTTLARLSAKGGLPPMNEPALAGGERVSRSACFRRGGER